MQNDFQKQQDQCSGYPYRAYQGIPAQITVTEAHNSQSEFC